jgi:uncharacterized membrane protein
VDETAAFCRKCGSRQPNANAAPPPSNAAPPTSNAAGETWLNGFTPKTASTLCYLPVIGWMWSLVVLSTQRFRDDRVVRFHAFQGLYLFVAWMLVDFALAPILGFGGGSRKWLSGMLHLVILLGWFIALIRTAQGTMVRLPFLGELADRSMAEQTPGK